MDRIKLPNFLIRHYYSFSLAQLAIQHDFRSILQTGLKTGLISLKVEHIF
jgi:hypothetical protein